MTLTHTHTDVHVVLANCAWRCHLVVGTVGGGRPTWALILSLHRCSRMTKIESATRRWRRCQIVIRSFCCCFMHACLMLLLLLVLLLVLLVLLLLVLLLLLVILLSPLSPGHVYDNFHVIMRNFITLICYVIPAAWAHIEHAVRILSTASVPCLGTEHSRQADK